MICVLRRAFTMTEAASRVLLRPALPQIGNQGGAGGGIRVDGPIERRRPRPAVVDVRGAGEFTGRGVAGDDVIVNVRIDHHQHQIIDALVADEILQQAFATAHRSEEHTSELQSLMRISYAVFCLTTKIYTT